MILRRRAFQFFCFIFVSLFALNSLILSAWDAHPLLVSVFLALFAACAYSTLYYYSLKNFVKLSQFLTELSNISETDEIHDKNLKFYGFNKEWKSLEAQSLRLQTFIRRKIKALTREKTELRTIMNTIDQPVLAISEKQKIIFYNPALGVMLDLHETKMPFDLSVLFRNQGIRKAYTETLAQGVPSQTQITYQSNQKEYTMNLMVTPLKRENRSSYGALGVFLDRTEHVEMNKKRMDFVANASHELRTPVTLIASAVSLMKSGPKENVRDQCLDILGNQTKRLVDLTEDLLDLSQLESGEQLQFDWIATREITLDCLNLLPDSNRVINVTYDSEMLYGDRSKVSQVLYNLLSNACRYSSEELDIQVKWYDDPKSQSVILEVIDEGPGIAPKHHSRIFERFYRVDHSRNRKKGGTGIGLAIVKYILKLHGGDILLESDVGKGTRFKLNFPYDYQKENSAVF